MLQCWILSSTISLGLTDKPRTYLPTKLRKFRNCELIWKSFQPTEVYQILVNIKKMANQAWNLLPSRSKSIGSAPTSPDYVAGRLMQLPLTRGIFRFITKQLLDNNTLLNIF